MFSITVFNNIYDTNTKHNYDFDTWEQFKSFFYRLSEIPLKNKAAASLICPATYHHNTTRANKNVIEWAGWAALDVDSHDLKGYKLKDSLKEKYGSWEYLCYSTASSTAEKPKFRLVFPLKCEVKADDIRNFWFALNSEFDELGDKQVKDFSRMYYTPGKYDGAYNFIFDNEGAFIDPYALIDKHPNKQKTGRTFFERLPEDMQKMIIQHRADQAQNSNISWSGYSDCPFINKKLLKEYERIAYVDGTGRYAMIYKLMVSIACNAVSAKYPIMPYEIVQLIEEIDRNNSNIYESRPLMVEAERAIEYAYSV